MAPEQAGRSIDYNSRKCEEHWFMEYLSEGAHLEDEGKDGVKEKKKKKKKKDKKKKKKKEVTLLANGYCVGYLSDLFNDTAS